MNNRVEPANIVQQTPGQIIKKAREMQQLTINDVAQKLLLSKEVIAALEADNYSKISAQVYAEGYLKAYAQFLQLPLEPLVQSFRRLNIYSQAEMPAQATPQATKRLILANWLKQRQGRLILLSGLGALFLSIILFVITRIFIQQDPPAHVTMDNSLDHALTQTQDAPSKEQQLPLVITDSSAAHGEQQGNQEITTGAEPSQLSDSLKPDTSHKKTKTYKTYKNINLDTRG